MYSISNCWTVALAINGVACGANAAGSSAAATARHISWRPAEMNNKSISRLDGFEVLSLGRRRRENGVTKKVTDAM